jgi:hypothetical protein
MATAGRLIEKGLDLSVELNSLSRVQSVGMGLASAPTFVHVTRVDFSVSILTLSAPDLKLFLKGIG